MKEEKEPELGVLFKTIGSQGNMNKPLLITIGALLTPITLAGAIWGYVRAYNRVGYHQNKIIDIKHIDPFTRKSMIIFAVLGWGVCIVGIYLFYVIFSTIFPRVPGGAIIGFVMANIVISFVIMYLFKNWSIYHNNITGELGKFGKARWGEPSDVEDFRNTVGTFVGGNHSYNKDGHIITASSTRGGKGVNLIIPNLLGLDGDIGSWFVIDPKGENAAVTAKYQRSKGKNVYIVDPWKINGNTPASYNPLDLLKNDESLADDATIISDMVVPENAHSKDPFWDERSKSLITGLIMHLIVSEPRENQTLTKIWEWLRLPDDEFGLLLAGMAISDNPAVKACANETLSFKTNSDKVYSSILGSAQSHTDFLKSPMLQKSLDKSDLDINTLTDGKTCIYVIIPADKLHSHYQWLRIIITTALRSAARNKNKKVTFLLDEFAALGKMSEVEMFLGIGAGYHISLWMIMQSLVQLKNIYGENWESFLGNTAVKQFFNTKDLFTADYLSKFLGTRTDVSWVGNETHNADVKAIPLANPDDLIRGLDDHILTFIDSRPPMLFPKRPYYDVPFLAERAEANPYFTEQARA
jgi:type IV secretion system protein VirD4